MSNNEDPNAPAPEGIDLAMGMFENLDSGGGSSAPPPAPPPPPPPPAAPFEDIEPPAPGAKPSDLPPPAAPDLEGIPDHVVRKGEAAITGWKQLRAADEAKAKRIADMVRDQEMKELEIQELKDKLTKVPKPEDLEAANKRATEFEETLGRIDVTQSPRFKELYDKPIGEVFGKVVRQFIKAGDSQEAAVEKARRVFKPGMQDPQALSQVLDGESSLVVGAVSALLDEREQLAQRRDEAVQNWRQERAADDQDRVRREAATISDQLTKAATAGFQRAAKEGSFLFQEGEDPKWNEGVKTRRDAVMGFIRGGKPEELAYLVAEGVASPVYRNAYARMKAENDDLKAQLASISGVRPGMGAGSVPGTGAPPAQVAPPATVNEAIDQIWAED